MLQNNIVFVLNVDSICLRDNATYDTLLRVYDLVTEVYTNFVDKTTLISFEGRFTKTVSDFLFNILCFTDNNYHLIIIDKDKDIAYEYGTLESAFNLKLSSVTKIIPIINYEKDSKFVKL